MSHLERLADGFPDVPPTVLLKADLLRCGIRPLASNRGTEPARLPGTIELPGGVHVFVSANPASRYILIPSGSERRLTLAIDEKRAIEPIIEVGSGPRFRWTLNRTSRGTPIARLFTPSLGGACGALALAPLAACQFATSGDDCRFCGDASAPALPPLVPEVDDVREAIAEIRNEQRTMGYLAFTGGSLFDRAREADAYVECMRVVRATGAALPTTVAAAQALDRVDSWRLQQAGFDYASYSMDVWDRRLWPEVVPGKRRSVGRERWMACLQEAVDIFGKGRVLCNFVAGVETAVPHVFASTDEAVDSTLHGMRWCYTHGIYPKYTVWVVAPGSRYGGRKPAPLDYYVRLMVGRQQLFREYEMRVPATECQRCLTQSFEADLARLDPAKYGAGAAGAYQWHKAHPPASSSLN